MDALAVDADPLQVRAQAAQLLLERVRRLAAQPPPQLADLFETYPGLVLSMPAEGTRSRRDHWKSGFYHIACEAEVPIVCGYLDYARKCGGFGLTFSPTGDIAADMDKIRSFYSEIQGKYPENFSDIRLREEAS